jgi:hypothetical protein
MKQITRRVFVRSALLTTVSATFLPGCVTSRVRGRVVGPNEEIRVAVVGFRGRGPDHIRSIMTLREKGEKVRLVALCDADRNILEAGVKSMRDKGVLVQGYMDMRDVFASGEVDVVTFATPNHWHALGTVWAVQAGKDVYVEKPVSHNVWEGRKAVDAARKYGRIVQAGTQSRSSRAIAEAVAWVRAGNLGKIKVSRGLCYKRRRSIGNVQIACLSPYSVLSRRNSASGCHFPVAFFGHACASREKMHVPWAAASGLTREKNHSLVGA